jgi:hypothetical protein
MTDCDPLDVDAALLMSGGTTSTVVRVDALDESLTVTAAELPVTVSPSSRFQSVDLTIRVRDCTTATRSPPGDRPFTIEWRDEYGETHLDKAGDFGRAMAFSLIRYIDAVCEVPTRR